MGMLSLIKYMQPYQPWEELGCGLPNYDGTLLSIERNKSLPPILWWDGTSLYHPWEDLGWGFPYYYGALPAKGRREVLPPLLWWDLTIHRKWRGVASLTLMGPYHPWKGVGCCLPYYDGPLPSMGRNGVLPPLRSRSYQQCGEGRQAVHNHLKRTMR